MTSRALWWQTGGHSAHPSARQRPCPIWQPSPIGRGGYRQRPLPGLPLGTRGATNLPGRGHGDHGGHRSVVLWCHQSVNQAEGRGGPGLPRCQIVYTQEKDSVESRTQSIVTPVWSRVSCHVCGVGWRDSSQEGKESLSRAEKPPEAPFAKKRSVRRNGNSPCFA